MKKLAIIVIGYNRLHSLRRLLTSIDKANYSEDHVDLIISLDKSDNLEVEKYAQKFEWKYGDKIIKTYPERLGLRNHILKCGSYLNDYDAAAVLEDDIVVSPEFYLFMKKMVEKYSENNDVAGVSLYSHQWNVLSNRPFYPMDGKYDVYKSSFAQSWGQIWFKNQWNDFYKWYKKNNENFKESKNVPQVVSEWPASSWLKYHIKYCVEQNKTFIYPYISYTTNFSDVGQHRNYASTSYQVPLQISHMKSLRLPDSINSLESYDVYFENNNLYKYLNKKKKDVCIDLYGTKHFYENKRYVLSSNNLDFKIVKSYALVMRPHEMNIIYSIEGDDIHLYDTTKIISNKKNQNNKNKYLYYDTKDLFNIKFMNIISFFATLIIEKLKLKIGKTKK